MVIEKEGGCTPSKEEQSVREVKESKRKISDKLFGYFERKREIEREYLKRELAEIEEGEVEREEFANYAIKNLPKKERGEIQERLEKAIEKGMQNEYNKSIERLKKGEIFTEDFEVETNRTTANNIGRAKRMAGMMSVEKDDEIWKAAETNPDKQYKHDIEIIKKGGEFRFERLAERTRLLAEDFNLPIDELESAIKEGAPIEYKRELEYIEENPFSIIEAGIEHTKKFAREYDLDEEEVEKALDKGIMKAAVVSSIKGQ